MSSCGTQLLHHRGCNERRVLIVSLTVFFTTEQTQLSHKSVETHLSPTNKHKRTLGCEILSLALMKAVSGAVFDTIFYIMSNQSLGEVFYEILYRFGFF